MLVRCMKKGAFADYVVLLASTRCGAELEVAVKAYSDVARAFGLSVRLQKIKFW